MARWTKGPTEGGNGRGHSGMEHHVTTAEVKDDARHGRRQADRAAIDEQLDELAEARETEMAETDLLEDWWDDGPTCSICDGLGHGYPGGPPCPLEVTDYSGEPSWAL